MSQETKVYGFYAGKSVFITGGTGFVGKVLIEKILRTLPEIKKIYVLMRTKRGQSCRERLEDFVRCPVFMQIQAKYPERLKKLQVINGDILAENLGISDEDRMKLIKETNIVFHCAASVRFNMPLRDATNMNVNGTKKVLDLAEQMKNLEVFLHASTSYCRCDLEVLEEKMYKSKEKPQDIINCVKWMDDKVLEKLEPLIIEPHPNTYAFTKFLTENIVSEFEGKFPIVVARPSIVTAAHKEPTPGWVDNLNGATGLIVGSSKGVIRTMLGDESCRADVIPVDMVANGFILVAYLTAVERPKEIQVYNMTESSQNPITWGEALKMGRHHVKEYPFSVCLWYPGGSLKTSYIQHQLALFFTHWLPAYFIDLLLYLMGKKPFLVKIQERINYGLKVLQYYTTKEWYFKNERYLSIRSKISAEEDETYYTDIKAVDWSEYIKNYIKGARQFCCKEDPSTLPQARKLHWQLYYLDMACQTLVYGIIGYFIYCFLQILFKMAD